MTEHRNFFRTVLDAMIESRTRQADRTLAHYRSTLGTFSNNADNR